MAASKKSRSWLHHLLMFYWSKKEELLRFWVLWFWCCGPRWRPKTRRWRIYYWVSNSEPRVVCHAPNRDPLGPCSAGAIPTKAAGWASASCGQGMGQWKMCMRIAGFQGRDTEIYNDIQWCTDILYHLGVKTGNSKTTAFFLTGKSSVAGVFLLQR